MFYDILLSLCKEHGITITALARNLDIAKGSPSNWQRGASPNSDVVVKIARYFGVSCDYLLGLDNVPSRTAEFRFTPEEQRLVLLLRGASPQAREAALVCVQAIVASMPGQQSLPSGPAL